LNNEELFTKTDDSGFTPLMIAVSAGRFEVAKFLLSFTQTDVNHQNTNGQSALFYACSKNNFQMTKLLLENGASVNVQDKYGNSKF
jgi:ankyrin repeat protein